MELPDYTKSLALELLSRYDSHISSALPFERIRTSLFRPPSYCSFPGLHCASYFRIEEVITALIEMEGCYINQRDCMGFTPLMWAARQGNRGAVTLLLTRDEIDPDKPENRGRTPLWWASLNGYGGVVRLLLARDDVNPDRPENDSITPLRCASRNGHEGVVSSVPNRPGARRGPAGGLPRAPDGTGRLAVVRPVRPKGRTVVFG